MLLILQNSWEQGSIKPACITYTWQLGDLGLGELGNFPLFISSFSRLILGRELGCAGLAGSYSF